MGVFPGGGLLLRRDIRPQGVIHPRLPAGAGGLERRQHVRVEADGGRDLQRLGERGAAGGRAWDLSVNAHAVKGPVVRA